MKCDIYILVGGESKRFGESKANYTWAGKRWVEHLVGWLSPIARSFTMVGGEDEWRENGMRWIPDVGVHGGPVEGLRTALVDFGKKGGVGHGGDVGKNGDDSGGKGWILLIGCDALIEDLIWYEELIAARRTACDAVLYRGEFWEPMPGLYQGASLAKVEEAMREGVRSMQGVLNRLQVKALPLPPEGIGITQANTKQDFQQWIDSRDVDV